MTKEYIAPEMEVIEINCQNELLMGSTPVDESPSHDEMA